MKPWTTLGCADTPDGSWLELRHHDGEYVISADVYDLMTSRQHGSEDAMMRLACPAPAADACVLIGGLGMGYTLRATLDALSATASVVVAELIPEVVEWNRGPLGNLTGRPLDDARVAIWPGDVAAAIRSGPRKYDAILLDVDNGPGALTQRPNGWLYSPAGLARDPLGTEAGWIVGGMGRLTGPGFRTASAPGRLRAHDTPGQCSRQAREAPHRVRRQKDRRRESRRHPGACHAPVARSIAAANASTSPSCHAGPATWTPIGMPFPSLPVRTVATGQPVRLNGSV